MKKDESHCVSGASDLMRLFLGAFLLLLGLNMLLNYQASVDMLMGVGGNIDLGPATPLADIVTQIVAYTWPVLKTLIGLSLLTKYYSCWAKKLLVLFFLVFALAHMWTGDQTAAILDILIVLFVCIQKGLCGLSKACK